MPSLGAGSVPGDRGVTVLTKHSSLPKHPSSPSVFAGSGMSQTADAYSSTTHSLLFSQMESTLMKGLMSINVQCRTKTIT